MAVSRTFTRFFESEKSSGVIILICTIVSLAAANSALGPAYLEFWHVRVGGLTVGHWINDGFMAVFFLLVGLELERELYVGELANVGNAVLPIVAALGGILVPALIHFTLNFGTATQSGIGIPMATDIAFALGVLALVQSRVPSSLKVFLTAIAVMDDLAAIVVIALFYTAKVSVIYLSVALAVFVVLVIFNRVFRLMALVPYLLGGALGWFCMLKSGVHATVAGVLLAFAIPFSSKVEDEDSPSHRLENFLQRPVAFVVLPLFALANTGLVIASGWREHASSPNSVGIVAGLVLGKPVGITLATFIAVAIGLSTLPPGLNWRHVFGAGLLGGIGFTMSIFITNLAFPGEAGIVSGSKLAILLASVIAGLSGFAWLRMVGTTRTGAAGT